MRVDKKALLIAAGAGIIAYMVLRKREQQDPALAQPKKVQPTYSPYVTAPEYQPDTWSPVTEDMAKRWAANARN